MHFSLCLFEVLLGFVTPKMDKHLTNLICKVTIKENMAVEYTPQLQQTTLIGPFSHTQAMKGDKSHGRWQRPSHAVTEA